MSASDEAGDAAPSRRGRRPGGRLLWLWILLGLVVAVVVARLVAGAVEEDAPLPEARTDAAAVAAATGTRSAR